jgi:hypothetical protein
VAKKKKLRLLKLLLLLWKLRLLLLRLKKLPLLLLTQLLLLTLLPPLLLLLPPSNWQAAQKTGLRAGFFSPLSNPDRGDVISTRLLISPSARISKTPEFQHKPLFYIENKSGTLSA